MGDYERYGRKYYEAHKAEILAKEKEKGRWKEYYEKNREEIAERNRVRYYTKKGLPVPEKQTRQPKPPKPTDVTVKRFEELVSELRTIAPQIVKAKRTRRAKAPESEMAA